MLTIAVFCASLLCACALVAPFHVQGISLDRSSDEENAREEQLVLEARAVVISTLDMIEYPQRMESGTHHLIAADTDAQYGFTMSVVYDKDILTVTFTQNKSGDFTRAAQACELFVSELGERGFARAKSLVKGPMEYTTYSDGL